VLYQWYPDFFFDTDGGWEGMRIIVAVDLILGPLLTLIVFKSGKPGMRTDLIMIGVFQAVCLSGGVYVVHGERPIALVYVDGQFNSMTNTSYHDAQVTPPQLDTIAGDYPKRIQVSLPEDISEESGVRRDMLRSKRQMNLLTDYYAPFDATDPTFINAAYPLKDLLDRDQEVQQLPKFIAAHGGTAEDYNFYPLNTRYSYFFLGFRKADSTLVGLLKTPGPL